MPAETCRFAFARVRVGRYLDRRVESDADLLQEVAREVVAVDQLDDARVQVQLDADVEVVGAVELIVVRRRLRHAVTVQDRAYQFTPPVTQPSSRPSACRRVCRPVLSIHR